MLHKSYIVVCLFISLLFIQACSEDETYTPKPTGYYRINLPKKEYISFNDNCPFTFLYPNYASVVDYKGNGNNQCWKNINIPTLNATLYLSYFPLQNNLDNYIKDARDLVYRHTVKAQSIDEKVFNNAAKKVYAITYDIGGNAASSYQFYITDSTKHFVRGSLYFNCKPNADSLAPVNAFVKADIIKMIETLEWK